MKRTLIKLTLIVLSATGFFPAQAGIVDWLCQTSRANPHASTGIILASAAGLLGYSKSRYDYLGKHRKRVSDISAKPLSEKSKENIGWLKDAIDLNKESLLEEVKTLKNRFIAHRKLQNHHTIAISIADTELAMIDAFDKHCKNSLADELNNAVTIKEFVTELNIIAECDNPLLYDDMLNKAIKFMEELEYQCNYDALDENQEAFAALGIFTGMAAILATLYINS